MLRCLLTLTLLLGAAQAVILTPPTGTAVVSGVSLTLPLTFHNPEAGRVTLRPTLELPVGWRVLLPLGELTLEGGETRTELLTLVPGPAAGVQTLSVRWPGGQGSVHVQVPERHRLSVRPLEVAPQTLGPRSTLRFVVQNLGNTPERVRLEAESDLGATLTVQPPQATLAPGTSLEVSVHSVLPEQVPAGELHRVQLWARGEVTAGTSASQRVLREALPLEARAYTLRGSLSAWGDSTAQTGGQLVLRGRLSEVLPGTLSVRVDRSSAQLGYHSEARWGQLGDLRVQATRSLPSISLRGLEGGLAPRQGWRVSGFVGQASQGVAFGSSVAFRQGGAGAALGLQGQEGALLIGAELDGQLGGVRLRGGLGYDRTHAQRSVEGQLGTNLLGGQAELRGRLSPQGFAGSEEEVAELGLSWTGRPGGTAGLRLSALGRETRSSETRAGQLRLEGQLSTPEARWSGNAQLERSPQQAALSLNLGLERGGWSGELGWAQRCAPACLESLKLGWTSTLTLGELTLSPRLGGRLDLGSTPSLHLSGGLGAALQQGDTRFGLSLDSADLGRGVWQLSGELGHPVAGVQLRVQGGLTLNSSGVSGARLKVQGQIPLELATGRRGALARLEGRVSGTGGEGLPGLTLSAGGLVTTTDAQGHYTFEALPAGPLMLEVLPDSSGALPQDLLPPVPLTLAAGEQRTVDLRLRRGAALEGQVQLIWPDPLMPDGTRLDLPLRPPLEGLRVTLHGDGTERTLTLGAGGRFTASGLPAGRYTVSLDSSYGPEAARYRLEGNTALELQEGQTVPLELRLLPIARTVRLTEGETLELESAP